jgi:hypothetical protein
MTVRTEWHSAIYYNPITQLKDELFDTYTLC